MTLIQLSAPLTVTDGGLETTLVFHHGIDLPDFAAFPLLDTEAGRAGAENSFAGRVVEIGYLGDTSIYKVRLDGGPDIRAAVANRTRRVERAIGTGDRVWLSWPPEAGVVLEQ